MNFGRRLRTPKGLSKLSSRAQIKVCLGAAVALRAETSYFDSGLIVKKRQWVGRSGPRSAGAFFSTLSCPQVWEHAVPLSKQMDRLAALNEAVGQLVEQTMAKRGLVNAQPHNAAERKRVSDRLGVAAKSYRIFYRRTGRATALEHADPAIAIESVELAIRDGQLAKLELELYDTALDELLTAL